MSYATTIIVGHLGRDPEQRYMPSGDAVTSFSVAVSRKWTGKDGEQQEKTTWYNVSVFGAQADPCAKYLAKGRLVLVEGDVEARAYLARDGGEARASLDLRARTVRFLGGRGDGEAAESEPQASAVDAALRQQDRMAPPATVRKLNLNDDDVPF